MIRFDERSNDRCVYSNFVRAEKKSLFMAIMDEFSTPSI